MLLGLLLPAVGRVRSAARTVACQANLKSLNNGLLLYAQDNRQYLPYFFNGNDAMAAAVGEFEGNMNWYERLQKGRYGNDQSHSYLDIDPGDLGGSVYACPFRGEIEAEDDDALFTQDNRSQYSINQYLYGRRNGDGSFSNARPVVRLIQAAGGTLAFSDAAFFKQAGQLVFRDEFNEKWGNGGTINGPMMPGTTGGFGNARTPWPVDPQDGTIRNGWHGGRVNASNIDGGVEKFDRWGPPRQTPDGPTPFERRIVLKYQN